MIHCYFSALVTPVIVTSDEKRSKSNITNTDIVLDQPANSGVLPPLSTEAEHGYASLLPLTPEDSDKRSKQRSKKIAAGGNR